MTCGIFLENECLCLFKYWADAEHFLKSSSSSSCYKNSVIRFVTF